METRILEEEKQYGQRKSFRSELSRISCALTNLHSQSKRQGGPTVDWFEIQPSLENAHADVLLVFDCCHASLATKARHEGKLELLAASSAAGVTPCPGPNSFTRYFKDELEKAVSETGSLQVDELHVRVNRRTMETTRITPVHFNMRSDPPQSITLRPLSQPQNKLSPLGAFTFTVSVSEAPSQHNIRQLGEWMKRTAPSTIFAINVDKVVDLSTSLQGFLLDEDRAGVEGRFIDTLQPMEKATLLAELRKLGYNVADASLSSTFPSTPTTSPLAIMSTETSPNLGTTIFQRFERGVNGLFQSTWSAVSRHPAFQSDTGLERLEHNEAAQRAGISAAASMSVLAQNPTPLSVSEAAFIPCDGIIPKRLIKDDDRFSLAMDTEKDRPIILEIIRYSPDEDRPPTKELDDQFAKTSSLLARPKPEYYRILRCVGYTHNKDESWYGLGFEIPKGYALYSTLESQFTKTPRVPLERRYDLAYSIALSISALHNVHWVHKGIRSENVLFFRKKGDAGARLDQPWLFGFEYTRDNAADSSKDTDYRLHRLIYLPPSRWGKPAEKFTYEHDVYALVSPVSQIPLIAHITHDMHRACYFSRLVFGQTH